MAFIKRRFTKPVIDLAGPDGNAYVLLGNANLIAKDLGMPDEVRKAVLDDMQSGNYEHLLQVFDKHFGHVVDLVR